MVQRDADNPSNVTAPPSSRTCSTPSSPIHSTSPPTCFPIRSRSSRRPIQEIQPIPSQPTVRHPSTTNADSQLPRGQDPFSGAGPSIGASHLASRDPYHHSHSDTGASSASGVHTGIGAAMGYTSTTSVVTHASNVTRPRHYHNTWSPEWSTYPLKVMLGFDLEVVNISPGWDDEYLVTRLKEAHDKLRGISRRIFSFKSVTCVIFLCGNGSRALT